MRTLCAFLLLAAATTTASAQDVPKKAVTVPFKLLPSRHMLIEAKVNGKGPFKLIFDTGAPINLLSTKLGKEAGISKGGGGFSLFSSLQPTNIGVLQIGEAKAEKLPAIVMDHPTVNAISDAFEDEYGRIDGIIGFPFFARFATTIDYQKKQIGLTPTDYTPGDYLQDLSSRLMQLSESAGKPKIIGSEGLWGFVVDAAKDDQPGVLVSQVYAKTPAAKGGLKRGDRLLTLDGRWTDSLSDTHLAASLVKPGRTVEVVVKRAGKETKLSITPTIGY